MELLYSVIIIIMDGQKKTSTHSTFFNTFTRFIQKLQTKRGILLCPHYLLFVYLLHLQNRIFFVIHLLNLYI